MVMRVIWSVLMLASAAWLVAALVAVLGGLLGRYTGL